MTITRGQLGAGGLVIATLALACGGSPPPRRGALERASAGVGDTAPPPSDDFAPAALMADVEWLCAAPRQGRGSNRRGARVAADYVEAEFRAAGLEVIRQQVGGASDNVIGILRGDDDAILVSAHHDHLGVVDGEIYPGADDNASGLAVVLALARDAARRADYAHTIVFISFAAEEVGLVGSAAYVANPAWPLERTLAVINFDMVGRNFFEAGVDRTDTAGVIGLEDHAGARVVTERSAGQTGLELVIAPARLVEAFGFALRTDDWRFRRQGLVAIHFSTGFHADYHRPTDTPGRLVPTQIEKVARTARGLLGFLAVSAESGG